jgi:hypothetical protein
MSSARKNPPPRRRSHKKTVKPEDVFNPSIPSRATVTTFDTPPPDSDVFSGTYPKQAIIPDNPQLPESIAMTDEPKKSPRQLSSKIIVGSKIGAIKEKTRLYSIIGIATGFKTGESAYGPWVALKGNFEAQRFSDGQVFKATLAILPTEATVLVRAQLDANNGAVEFAYGVTAEPSTVAGAAYKYIVEPVIAARASDPLAGLRNALNVA